jgi:hypothetical protein
LGVESGRSRARAGHVVEGSRLPRVTIDFFRVHFADPNYNGTFEAVLATIDQRRGRDRNVPTTGGWNHFHRLTTSRNRHIGDLLRVQADQLPVAADRDGTIEDLALEHDQGIAAVTYFYYRLSNRVLLMLRSSGGLSGPGFEHLIKELGGVDVELRPVPQLETLERLRRLRQVRKISFKLATPDPEHHLRVGRGVEGLFDLMGEFEASVADVTLSVDRRRDSRLNRGRAIALLESLYRLGQRSTDVKKATVQGLDPTEERTIALDLLHGRMVERVEVPVGPNRRLSEDGCTGALENAYVTRSAELEELYG